MRVGVKVPSSGSLPMEHGIAAMAKRAEQAGFASLWCSDHIVMPSDTSRSVYPFAPDGKPTWDLRDPWYDAVVAMTTMAAVTERAEVGCAVLVLPLRQPVTFAKQLASLHALSGGRVALGVGAGWLREEFEALQADFDRRGAVLDEWLEVMRRCWSGEPQRFDGEHYRLPEGVLCYPTPPRPIPILIGGMSKRATARAGEAAGGWLALQSADGLDPGEIAAGVEHMRASASSAGRDPEDLRVTMRITASGGRRDELAPVLSRLGSSGVDEVIVDVEWDEDDLSEVHAVLAGEAS